MAKSKTSFDSKNQPDKRKPRGKAKRTIFLEALQEELKLAKMPADTVEEAESKYYQFCIRVGMGLHTYFEENQDGGLEAKFGKPDTQLLKEGMSRLFPPNKQTLPPVYIDIKDCDSRVDKAEKIIDAVVSDGVPADQGAIILGMLKDVTNFELADVIDSRLAEIEKKLEGGEE